MRLLRVAADANDDFHRWFTPRRIAPQTGLQSQFVGGEGCGVANRGLDFGGHSFSSGEAYTGHFFAKGGTAATVAVSLFDWKAKKALATQIMHDGEVVSWATIEETFKKRTAQQLRA